MIFLIKHRLIEVGTQSEIDGYSIGDFAKYLDERTSKHKVLNLISLEISKTPLNSKVSSPRVVRSIDWIDNAWYQNLL
jgi:F-box/leucine-rich repeat protein 10/11